jgi:hypothetical protein
MMGTTSAGAQLTRAQRDSLCASVLSNHKLTGPSCQSLAVAAVTVITESFYAPQPRDVQNTNARAATAGSIAQNEAIPSVQPEAVAGASVAAAGTDSGTRTIAAISVNPALFFVPIGNSNRIATASRIADLTFLVPTDNIDEDGNGRPDYFGVRLRINVNGAQSGRAITEAGRAFLRSVQADADMMVAIRAALLETVPDIPRCGNALLTPGQTSADLQSACGIVIQPTEARYAELRRTLAIAREEADAKYLGLDVRADWGDATLGSVADAEASAITAAVAFGRRVTGADPRELFLGIRGRAGYRYSNLWKTNATSRAFDGGFGLEARKSIDETSAVMLSAGIEARYGGEEDAEEQLQTNYTVFRATLAVPIAGATGLSIAFGTPLAGQIDPTFNVNFNWSVLLPKLGFGPR